MVEPVERRPTIADVAREAGVSRTTVSHSLNDIGQVDPRTRARVKEVARQLGYRPNLRAQRLRTGQAHTLGLVSSMPMAIAAGPSRLGFFTEVAAAAAEAALTHGFALVLVPPLEVSPSLDHLDVDGVIVVEPEEGDRATEQLVRRRIPVVTLGRQPGAEVDIPYADLQARAVGSILLEHLYAEGARNIALLIGSSRRHSYVDVAAAYEDFTQSHDLPSLTATADEGGGEEAGYLSCLDLLDRHHEIDAVCAPVDAFAVGAVRALTEAGRRVPDDVLVVTRYDGLRARTCSPPLTAVGLHLDDLASGAVELLLEHVRGERGRHVVVGPAPELIARRSSLRRASAAVEAGEAPPISGRSPRDRTRSRRPGRRSSSAVRPGGGEPTG
jgi:DNA-binding LacI/PurR family transcriptional regulator